MINIAHFWNWNRVAAEKWEEPMVAFAACGHTQLAMTAQLSLQAAFSSDFWKSLKEKAKAAGVTFSGVHAPFGGKWDLLAGDPEFLPVSMHVHKTLLELLPNEFGIHTYTMHLMNDLFPGTTEQAVDQLGGVLEPLLEVAARHQVIIAIENGFQPIDSPDTLPHYLHRYASENLGCCLDLAHAHVIAHRRHEDLDRYIDLLLPSIVVCHLHDNDGKEDRHWVPGDGIIDWRHVMPRLTAAPRLQSLQNESHSDALSIEALCHRIDVTLRGM